MTDFDCKSAYIDAKSSAPLLELYYTIPLYNKAPRAVLYYTDFSFETAFFGA
jgi:hypothetical protein